MILPENNAEEIAEEASTVTVKAADADTSDSAQDTTGVGFSGDTQNDVAAAVTDTAMESTTENDHLSFCAQESHQAMTAQKLQHNRRIFRLAIVWLLVLSAVTFAVTEAYHASSVYSFTTVVVTNEDR